jgi:hypothetical protein
MGAISHDGASSINEESGMTGPRAARRMAKGVSLMKTLIQLQLDFLEGFYYYNIEHRGKLSAPRSTRRKASGGVIYFRGSL